eukprot:TRINITY_DN11574_c0_g1_i1.p1 TRINITY_DN11574_c0_g1~~TRINITY_DN11574_c0_g1_i1.p1  ORF type:complete len:305 (+),score=17.53 TRINITY_DN11574_c0_g1_i1:547-1461(+)
MLEGVHNQGFVHRDIRPENFLLGPGEDTLYLIGYQVAKPYWDKLNQEHISFKENRKLMGTVQYASINAQAGCEQSRRDDLESLGYILAYMLKGMLPWQGLDTEEVMKCKTSVTSKELYAGFPEEFATYLSYCRSLLFEEKPDYKYLKKLFRDCFTDRDLESGFIFDWKTVEVREESPKTVNCERLLKEEEAKRTKAVRRRLTEETKSKNICLVGSVVSLRGRSSTPLKSSPESFPTTHDGSEIRNIDEQGNCLDGCRRDDSGCASGAQRNQSASFQRSGQSRHYERRQEEMEICKALECRQESC